MKRISPKLFGVAALAFAVLPAAALAQDAGGEAASAELAGGASNGVVAANIAAGDANQQANVGFVAVGLNAHAIGVVAQALTSPPMAHDGAAQAGIADNAFAGSSGWMAANIAAGSANQQANVAGIAIGLEGQALTTAMLSQSRASLAKTDAPGEDQAPGEYATRIGDGAFEASSGLVQLNLAAGDNNTSANVFGLSIAAP
jgi:hypothetical protein